MGNIGEWSARFDAYLTRTGLSTSDAAAMFGASKSMIFAWRRGSEPREGKKLQLVARKTRGEVPAELATAGKNRAGRHG